MKETEINENQEIPKEENESRDNQEVSPETDVPKKKNFFKTVTGFVASKTLNGLKTAGNTIVTEAKKVNDSYHSFAREQTLKKKKREIFENDCQTYLIVGKTDKKGFSYSIQAVRFREKNELFFMYDEEDLSEINSHVRLKNTSDGSEIEILEVEKEKTFYYPIIVEDKQEEIAGILASYRLYDSTKASINITHNSIQNNNINGDNAQVSQVITYTQELDILQSEITNSKVNLFHKKQKEEALNLFGNFRDCVINQKKDESLFKKFLKVLGELSLTVAVKIAETLISKIG